MTQYTVIVNTLTATTNSKLTTREFLIKSNKPSHAIAQNSECLRTMKCNAFVETQNEIYSV